jgi:hypothetical protein
LGSPVLPPILEIRVDIAAAVADVGVMGAVDAEVELDDVVDVCGAGVRGVTGDESP